MLVGFHKNACDHNKGRGSSWQQLTMVVLRQGPVGSRLRQLGRRRRGWRSGAHPGWPGAGSLVARRAGPACGAREPGRSGTEGGPSARLQRRGAAAKGHGGLGVEAAGGSEQRGRGVGRLGATGSRPAIRTTAGGSHATRTVGGLQETMTHGGSESTLPRTLAAAQSSGGDNGGRPLGAG